MNTRRDSKSIPELVLLCAAIIGFAAVSVTATPNEVVNLKQWPASEGGNGHWYGVIPTAQYWRDAVTAAGAQTHDGLPGYLATITSAEENAFVFDQVLIGLTPPTILPQYWLGGKDMGMSQWQWLNGETWDYTNWATGEPNNEGVETALCLRGYGMTAAGMWNNALPDDSIHTLHQWWSVVEFSLDSPPPPADTLVNLVQWPSADGGNGHWYGVLPHAVFWEDAMTVAGQLTHLGQTGYLATVTSAEENAFLFEQVIAGLEPQTILPQYWLGGQDAAADSWGWATGEAWQYTNWAPGEPNNLGIETALCLRGNGMESAGMWNNALPDDSIHALHQWWAIIEFGSPDEPPPPPVDTLINLVQWPASAGGNDHWYAVMPRSQYWRDAVVTAGLQTHQDQAGYLATVTSFDENVFIRDSVIAGLAPQTILPQFWLGGEDAGVDQWQWLSGEAWEYTNWYQFEPNNIGIETALCMRGGGMASPGTWNNALPDESIHTLHQWWSVVEFGGVEVVADSLFFPSTSGSACTGCGPSATNQPVACYLEAPAVGATISFDIPQAVTVCEIRFDGYPTATWDFTLVDIRSDSGFVVVSLANSTGEVIPAGLSVLFDVRFAATAGGNAGDFFICWDTALSADPSRQTKFANEQFGTFGPRFNRHRDSTIIAVGGMAGDITGDSEVNLSDLIALIDNIFRGGIGPCNPNLADVNGDCSGPDIGDITYFIAYVFRGGTAPREGCIVSGKQNPAALDDLIVRTSFDGEATLIEIESQVALRGLQLDLAEPAITSPTLLLDNGLEVISGLHETATRIAVVDLEGEAVIPQGRTAVIRLAGQHEVCAALAADPDHRVHTAALVSGPSLPTSYALHQNYPNPFNPTTVLAFDLPGSVETRLEVFNVAGQRVALLVDRMMPPGIHEITWDAGNLASGVYVSRLTAGDFSATRKMLLLK